jgi:hypothetical protein
MKLKISRDDAENLLMEIPHQSCRKAIKQHWQVDEQGRVRAQSVCWLFCWAKTGMNSPEAARVAQHAFNEILPLEYETFDAKVDHEKARALRYASDDVDEKLEKLLLR